MADSYALMHSASHILGGSTTRTFTCDGM